MKLLNGLTKMCDVSRKEKSRHEYQNSCRQPLKPTWLVVKQAIGETSRNNCDCKPESPGKFAPHQISIVAADGAPDYVFGVTSLKPVSRHKFYGLTPKLSGAALHHRSTRSR
jgi:hypothetical protein